MLLLSKTQKLNPLSVSLSLIHPHHYHYHHHRICKIAVKLSFSVGERITFFEGVLHVCETLRGGSQSEFVSRKLNFEIVSSFSRNDWSLLVVRISLHSDDDERKCCENYFRSWKHVKCFAFGFSQVFLIVERRKTIFLSFCELLVALFFIVFSLNEKWWWWERRRCC